MHPIPTFCAAVLVLGLAVTVTPAITVAAPMRPVASGILMASEPAIERAAIGDPPPGSRRRGRRAPGKEKPYQPLAKDPQSESAAAHKDYLKRYGF